MNTELHNSKSFKEYLTVDRELDQSRPWQNFIQIGDKYSWVVVTLK